MSGAAPAARPGGLRGLVAAFVRPAPSPPRFWIAVQAGVAMLLAVGVPALAGRPDVGLLASTGVLSALHLASRSRRERLRRLPLVQLALLVAIAAGALTRGNPVAVPVVLVVVAVGAMVLSAGFAIGPPGALFPVLGAGVATRLAGDPAFGGAGLDPLLLVGCAVAGCVLALLVVAAPLLVPSVRRRDRGVPVVPLRFELDGNARVVIVRVAVAAVVGAVLAALLGLERGYWVVVAVVSVLQGGRGRRLTGIRTLHRVVGTLVGAAVFVLLASLFGLPAPGLVLAVALGALQFGTEMVIVAHYGFALLFITPLALLIAEAGSAGDPWSIAGTRVLDTAIGCAVALVVLVVDRIVEGAPAAG